MPRHSDEAAPTNILQFPFAKSRPSFLQETQTAPSNGEILNRLQAENTKLRGKAVDLILQIQSLHDCNWDRDAS
jgi:hypothetical protein